MSGPDTEDARTFVLPTHDSGRPLMTPEAIADLLDAEDVDRALRR